MTGMNNLERLASLANDLMLFLVFSGKGAEKQQSDSLEIDDFQSLHVEHMLNQHCSVLIVTGKLR